jgi:hypothetical protein
MVSNEFANFQPILKQTEQLIQKEYILLIQN